MKQTVYVLRNEELGFIDDCPVFKTEKEAHDEACGKCRYHTVVEADLDKFKPCHPVPKYTTSRCEACAIYYKNFKK